MRQALFAFVLSLSALLAHLALALVLVQLGAILAGFLFLLWAPFFAVTYVASFLYLIYVPSLILERTALALLLLVCFGLPLLRVLYLPSGSNLALILILETALLAATLMFLRHTLRMAQREGLQQRRAALP